MRIEQAKISMNSEHALLETKKREERLLYWNDRSGIRVEAQSESSSVTISGEAHQMFAQTQTERPPLSNAADRTEAAQRVEEDDDSGLSDADKMKVRLIEAFWEKLTGRKVKLNVAVKLPNESDSADVSAQTASAATGESRAGWGFSYDRLDYRMEAERMQFAASGKVTTADGREIRFSIGMELQRSYTSFSQLQIRAGDAKLVDPLVLHLGEPNVSLTERKFAFDLNADGVQDQISFVQGGSLFLTLDRNGNGRVDDGSELFGALSGNGFAELSQLDDDGSGWINENDTVFERLKLWSKNERGEDILMSLGQAGVGAIYLGSEETPFTIKSTSNETQGQVRRSGFYLRENGAAGHMQQIDLSI